MIAKNNAKGTPKLVGYFTVEEGASVSENELMRHLEKNLVRVMVPAQVKKLEKFPVNINGKIDRNALLSISFDNLRERTEKPQTHKMQVYKQERLLEGICDFLKKSWSEILGIDKDYIHNDDDFFQLGADSISCILLLAHIRKKFNLNLKVEDVFNLRSLNNFVSYISVRIGGLNSQKNYFADVPLPTDIKALPTNGLHQGLLYHSLKTDSSDDAYIIQSIYKYHCEIALDLFKRSWEIAFIKYPGLRLQFIWDEEPQQIISSKDEKINWYYKDISHKTNYKEQESYIRLLQKKDRQKPYDLSKAPLFRVYLIKQKNNLYTVIFSCHHIILDGWSLVLLYDEIHSIYITLLKGKEVDLSEDKAYVAGQLYWAKHHKNSIEYWVSLIKSIGERSDFRGLLLDEKRYKVDLNSYDKVISHKECKDSLGKKLTNKIKKFCSLNHLTLHSVLQFVWHKTLHAIGAGESTIVGTVVSGRNLPIDGIEKSLGAYINTLPVIVNHNTHKGKTIQEVIHEIQSQVHALHDNCIVEFGRIENNTMKRSLFDTLLVLENYPRFAGEKTLKEHKKILQFEHSYDVDKVDHPLALVARETENELVLSLWYAGELFDAKQTERLLETAKIIFNQLEGDGSLFVNQLSFCSEQMLSELDKWNKTERKFREDATLGEIFEDVAREWSQEIAVVYEDIEMSYAELNCKANQLANKLLQIKSLSPNNFVALILDKNDRMIVSILAVWKAGLAYVPIDPNFPDERISFMLKDTEAEIIITNKGYKERVKSLTDREIVDIDSLIMKDMSIKPPVTNVKAHDLAYAIYTSGTTGQPKAVLVEHRNLLSFLDSIKTQYFPVRQLSIQSEKILFLSNYVFDFSIEQIILSLMGGHSLIIPSQNLLLGSDDFYIFVNQHQLSYLSGTPTQIHKIDLSRLTSIRTIVVAGEAFLKYHFQKIRETYKGRLFSAYGTTETTIYNTVSEFGLDSSYRNDIGIPLANTEIYILDENLKKLPDGAIGELCISGDCVGRGYLKQPDLTQNKFIGNCLSIQNKSTPFSKMYKTGDLVRRKTNGSIEYLGRNDSQVKINGVRVELSEIESVMVEYPGISQSAVTIILGKEDVSSKKHIVGFFVTNNNISCDKEDILKFIQKKLPLNMMPQKLFHVRDFLPLTVNGKVDKQALAQYMIDDNPSSHYIPPRNYLDAALCEIWREELGNTDIGIGSNFFREGGDSIKAMMLVSKIQKLFDIPISIKDLFDYPSVQEFSDKILKRDNQYQNFKDTKGVSIYYKRPTGECSLLPIQRWFFAKNLPKPYYWNQHFAIITPELDVKKLHLALNMLVNHHDAFRLRYKNIKGNHIQFYSENDCEVILKVLNVHSSKLNINRKIESLQESFDLQNGPTWCVLYLHGYSDNTARVYFIMHHLIVDTVSWQIITRDLEILYNGGTLDYKSASYKQWAQAVHSYLPQKNEKKYWNQIAREVLHDNNKMLSDFAEIQKITYHEEFQLSEEDTHALLTKCQRVYDTHILDLLLTVVANALTTVHGQTVNYVTLESYGRNIFRGVPDVRNTVGWFTALYPFRLEGHNDITQSILTIKESRAKIPHSGIGYGAIKGTYGENNSPLPLVSFNYLGQISYGTTNNLRNKSAWQLDHTLCGMRKAKDNETDDNFFMDITMFCANGCMNVHIDGWYPHKIKVLPQEIESCFKQVIQHTKLAPQYSPLSTHHHINFDPYIIVNKGNAKKTLFIFPPGEGGAESYLNNIVKHIQDTRLILFNNIHLHQPMESFEELAKFYIDQMIHIQSEELLNFLGWSFGGILALEVALQLLEKSPKMRPQNLIIIDSYFDVKYASESIGLPHIHDILDPINYYYAPKKDALEKLSNTLSNIVLFKATKVNDIVNKKHQKLLFDFYMKSPYNNLDRLIPPNKIYLIKFMQDTHHSWVKNEQQVLSMSAAISEFIDYRL